LNPEEDSSFFGYEPDFFLDHRGQKKALPHMCLTVSIISQFILTAAVFQIPAGRESFGVTMPTFQTIGIIRAFGTVVSVSMEAVKVYLRRRLWVVR
jgi:fluoride ion exporter CrcB/FEX